MQTISVMLQADNPSHIDEFQSIVERMRSKVQTHPVTIEPRLTQEEHLAVFRFVSWSQEEYTIETIDIVRAFVSLVIVEWIIRVMEPQIVSDCIRQELPMTNNEWPKVKPYIKRALNEPVCTQHEVGRTAMRKARLYRTFFTYLLENREIHLHGFARFRLKEYQKEVREAVTSALEEYQEDKQYEEFLELLRYFISTQDTQYETVHVVPTEKHFELFDEHGSLIALEKLETMLGMMDTPERSEDGLISALITLAPEKIVFHQTEKRQGVAQTVSSIFEGRVSYCSSCAHCLLTGRPLDLQQPTRL
ncbi:putative sporulation protein YtxC [Brevibacillus migulae]|uniref:putative sporulation protein YtxC n=1 Tax=Brevibacillus migulae TaxID=1644114 RepID=UPI00106E7B6C|nr:putative sporulation protein YtxC [Brevibacillus migulae]